MVDPFGFEQSELGGEVSAVDAKGVGGHHGHNGSRDHHRQGNKIPLKGHSLRKEVEEQQLRDGQCFEEKYISFEASEVDSLAEIEGRDVAEVVHEGSEHIEDLIRTSDVPKRGREEEVVERPLPEETTKKEGRNEKNEQAEEKKNQV